MTLNSLKYFEKLIETKSYSKVAKYYGVTQPAISMNIKRLENKFNDKLVTINKSKENIELTNSGENVHQHAKVILQQLQLIEDDIKNPQNKVTNLGVSPLINDDYFPNLVNKLKNDDITLIENDTDSLLDEISLGNLDLALIESAGLICKPGIQAEVIETDQINIIVSKDHALADQKTIDFRDLKDTPFITKPNEFLQAQLFKHFEQKYHTAIPVVSCGRDSNLMNQLVKQNIGFSFSLKQNFDDDLVALKLKNNKLPDFVLSIVHPKLHKLNTNEKIIIDTIKEESLSKKNRLQN